MSNINSKGRYDAVAVHDGQSWRLVVLNGTKVQSFASPANRLPQEFVDAAVVSKVRRILFLVSGEVHVIDGAIPNSASMAKVVEQLRIAIAEATGVDADDALVAGMTTSWPGVRRPFTAASRFDAGLAEDFRATLSDAGIACAGCASLELAFLAVWRKKVSGRQSFVSLSSSHAFVVPAPRGTNPGPQTVACGLRHFAMDNANWLTRFQRSAAAVEKGNPLHLLVLDAQERASSGQDPRGGGSRSCATEVSTSLKNAGYENIVEESPDSWLLDAAREAYAAKPNRCRNVSLPVVNPWEPHKKFSTFWLVAAAVVVLSLPLGYRTLCERLSSSRCSEIGREAAKLKPAADKARAAQRELAKAKADLSSEKAAGVARIDMRRPLVAFVDVAYFFCKYSGDSTVLTSIRQDGDRISANGFFTDPEDGVRLGKRIVKYAKDRHIQILENSVDRESAGAGASANYFTLVFDCSKVGKEMK